MTDSGSSKKKLMSNVNLRSLRLSLKYRPELLKLILKMRQCIRKRNVLLKSLKHRLKLLESNKIEVTTKEPSEIHKDKTENVSAVSESISGINIKECKDSSTQTFNDVKNQGEQIPPKDTPKLHVEKEEAGWNINRNGENQKSIAEQVKEVAQSALQDNGMVYVESAGMYYDYKTGYYYNSELGLYYHNDTGCYYHYSDDKKFVFHSYPDMSKVNFSLIAHQNKKAKKLKRERKPEDDIDNLTKHLSQVSLQASTTLDCIAMHHPPCMRVIVRETKLPKLKVGSLFLITKDGGTIGREGDNHAILLKDHNVSRNHLDIKYDTVKKTYIAIDLGSKNGTILNGVRMSESQDVSAALDVLHGSTIQLGETKLLCHIHAGHTTCGQCEPGLLMQVEEEKKAAYTRTVSVKKQFELELARLKNIYVPQRLAIEEKPYNDRAQARRDAVGSTNHAEKTQASDLDTSIPSENKGFKLLEKMGWSKGEGLGKDSQGDTEPVPLTSNDGKAGLGTAGAVAPPSNTPKPRVIKNNLASATMRLAARTKMLQPPAKAFQNEDEDDLE